LNTDLIILIIQTALAILQQQLGGSAGPTGSAQALLDIIAKAKAAYERETGQPIDVAAIKPYEPIP